MSAESEKPPLSGGPPSDHPGEKSPLNRSTAPASELGAQTEHTSSMWDRLPPWVLANLRSPRSRRMFLRCWIASWVAFLIMLPQKSLNVLGNAAFFALLASFMVPINVPVQMFFFAISTMVLGMCLGWAFGAAAMRGALASRDQLLLKQSLLREQQSVAGLSNPDGLFREDIFRGKFLDTKSTIVFGCFLGLGNFVFAAIRTYAPKLVLTSVFGTVALDVYCSYGPLFPFAQYTLLNSILTSVACYIALGIVVITLVFPETINHAALVSTSELLGKLKAAIDIQQEVLEASPDDLAPGSPLMNRLQGARIGALAHIQQLIASTKLIGLEFSWGKWNGEDVTALQQPLLAVASRVAALHAFAKFVGHPLSRTPTDDPSDPSSSSDPTTASLASSDTKPFVGDTYLLRQLRTLNHAAEAAHGVRLPDVLPAIDDATAPLRAACSAGLAAAQAVVRGVNTRRYARGGAREELEGALRELDGAVERLRGALGEFRERGRGQLLVPFGGLLESARGRVYAGAGGDGGAGEGDAQAGGEGEEAGEHGEDTAYTSKHTHTHTHTHSHAPLPLRSLYIAYVFAANLIVLAEGVLALLERVQSTAARRTRSRLWLPGGLRALVAAVRSRGEESDRIVGEDEGARVEEEVKAEEACYKLDPDSRPPTNVMQRFGNGMHAFYKWTKTPEALFIFRYVVLSIVLWIPSVVHRAAHFIYVEKGLWALIMAQTTLNVYASDQIYNYVIRIIGTFVGAVLGLLGWYLGSANGNGSPYGAAAVVGVFLIPLLFVRLFAPMQYLPGVLLFTVTFALIMGYSWIDGHLPVAGNPGIGWPIAWKRFVQVMIGSAASFVLMMLPPKSGRKAVRLRNAATVSALAFLYADIVSAWISSEGSRAGSGGGAAGLREKGGGEEGEGEKERVQVEWIPGFRERVLGLAQQLQALKVQTGMARWEGSVRGAWPGDEYMRLANVQVDMMSALALLGGALAQVDDEMRISFLQHTRVVNPNFIADVMATFSIVSQALRTGEPIPQAFRTNLFDRLHYHGDVGHQSFAHKESTHDEVQRQHLEAVSRYEYMFYATAISAVFQLLDGLNQIRDITVELCGEIPLPGYARWKEEYDRAHVHL